MSKPISPKDVQDIKNQTIPDEVIEAFNELITKNWNGHSATFKQDTVVALAIHKLKAAGKPHNRQALFNEHAFDVEDSFRKEGWKVKYDKPGFNENYDASFSFRKPSKDE